MLQREQEFEQWMWHTLEVLLKEAVHGENKYKIVHLIGLTDVRQGEAFVYNAAILV